MSDWLTYTLSDFLLFSPRTYYRLFELHNEALWPTQASALAVGLLIAFLTWRGGALAGRMAAALVAALWLSVAWSWHFERYATINWAAIYAACAFALEAVLILGVGLLGRRLEGGARDFAAKAGLTLLGFAVLLQPLVGPLLARPWSQAEVFGLMPDPTVAGTIGYLFAASRKSPWLLIAIPLLWCLLTGATLWTMGSPDALVMPLIGVVAIGLGLYRQALARRTASA